MMRRSTISLFGLMLWTACRHEMEPPGAGPGDASDVSDATDATDGDATDASNGDASDAGPLCDVPARCEGAECSTEVHEIAAGQEHVCALMRDGQVYCWGSNREGQLGLDAMTVSSGTPRLVPGITDAVDIAAGFHDTCVVRRDGSVWCWGSNVCGGFGDGRSAGATPPTMPLTCPGGGYARLNGPQPVALAHGGLPLPPVCQMTIGERHRCVITADTGLYCWGYNGGQVGFGFLGGGVTPDAFRSTPVRVLTEPGDRNVLTGVRQVSFHGTATCALVHPRDGGAEVRCWGDCTRGRCGTGSEQPVPYARFPVRELPNPVGLSAGAQHACAIVESDGRRSARCWGANRAAQATATGAWSSCQSTARPMVLADADISRVFAGNFQTCAALDGDLGLRCWGYTNYPLVGAYAPPGAMNNCPVSEPLECDAGPGPDAALQNCALTPLDITGPDAPYGAVTQVAFQDGFACFVNRHILYCLGRSPDLTGVPGAAVEPYQRPTRIRIP